MTVPSPRQVARRAQVRPEATFSDSWLAHVPAVLYARRVGDPPGAACTIGAQVEALLGYSPDDVLADPELWASRIHADDLGQALATWRHAGDRYRLTYRMLARDGHVRQVLDEAQLAEDPGTGEGRWYGVVVEITDGGLTGPQLREAEEKYLWLIEQIPAVTYIDEVPADDPTDLTPVYISPQIEQLLGYSREEWIRDPDLWDLVTHPDDIEAAEALARQAFENGTPLSTEYRMIALDGRTVWVREEASLFRDEHGDPKFWQGVYIDITELKRAEGELNNALVRERDAAERLRALDEMKNAFLQAVSHDLRTPLSAILGLALTLENEEIGLDDAEVRDIATRIAANSRKLDRMVADLLDLDRLSRGIMEPKLQRADVSAIARDLVAQLTIAEHRTLILDVESVTLAVDAPKVERIIENLLANAERHTPEGAHVWIRTRPRDHGVLIIVEDDGPGVPKELYGAVFEPFRQGPSLSSHSPGVGVGLALVARFAELHGGRAWVADRPGGGASFHVYLPGRPDA